MRSLQSYSVVTLRERTRPDKPFGRSLRLFGCFAEGGGFEPPRGCPQRHFQCRALDRAMRSLRSYSVVEVVERTRPTSHLMRSLRIAPEMQPGGRRRGTIMSLDGRVEPDRSRFLQMSEQENRRTIERLGQALSEGNLELFHEQFQADSVMDYAQSGERIVGESNRRSLYAAFPSLPKVSPQQLRVKRRPWCTRSPPRLRRRGRLASGVHLRVPRREDRQGNCVLDPAVRGSRVAGSMGGTN